MRVRSVDSFNEIPRERWNALQLDGNPFLQHEFLQLMESTGCASVASGWAPQHLLLEDSQGDLIGAAPLYLKPHSWGEFVFDWSWASAYERAGLSYYPKLVCAIPFTPASGSRLLVKPGADVILTRQLLIEGMLELARQHKASSVHALFAPHDEQQALIERGFMARRDCQFQWRNRGYTSFDHFLETFRADKRKKAKRERRRIEEAGVIFRTLSGAEMTAKLWDVVYGFSASTFAQHGHQHYLSVDFFRAVAQALPDNVMVKLAMHGNTPVASAVFFEGGGALYGRYWGAAAQFDSLHFETCYHQGIEYCIAKGLQRFEPGTQGEHKIARGFEPSLTYSAHWIQNKRFARAIDDYLQRESAAVDEYALNVRDHVPFRRDAPLEDPRQG
jgi:predicted N-acyltransferase